MTVGLCAGWTGLNWDIRSCAASGRRAEACQRGFSNGRELHIPGEEQWELLGLGNR